MSRLGHASKYAAALAMATTLGGCSLFSRGLRVEAPEQVTSEVAVAGRLDPARRETSYRAMFPPMFKVHLSGTLTAHGPLLIGKERLNFSYIALDDDNMRMLARKVGENVLDIVINQGYMTVALPTNAEIYQGQVPEDGTPFRRQLGVEPWEIALLYRIGELIAEGDFREEATRRAVVLTAVDPAALGGLTQVRIDARTGLPAEATWEHGNRRWHVQYPRWAIYTGAKGLDIPDDQIETRLMPAVIEIECEDPNTDLTLDMEKYWFDRYVPERMMVLRYPYLTFDLDKLEQPLADSLGR